jgi:hypothetical protein
MSCIVAYYLGMLDARWEGEGCGVVTNQKTVLVNKPERWKGQLTHLGMEMLFKQASSNEH